MCQTDCLSNRKFKEISSSLGSLKVIDLERMIISEKEATLSYCFNSAIIYFIQGFDSSVFGWGNPKFIGEMFKDFEISN